MAKGENPIFDQFSRDRELRKEYRKGGPTKAYDRSARQKIERWFFPEQHPKNGEGGGAKIRSVDDPPPSSQEETDKEKPMKLHKMFSKETAAKIRLGVDEARKWLDAGSDVVETLFYAGQAGAIGRVIAGASIVGKVADLVIPRPDPWGVFIEMGMIPKAGPATSMAHQILMQHPDRREVARDEDGRSYVFDDEDGEPRIGLTTEDSDLIYLSKEGGEDLLSKLMQPLWDQGQELGFTDGSSTGSGRRVGAANRLAIEPLPPAGSYVETDRPIDYYAERLMRYPPGARTVVFRGPSGVGKSVLARHIAAKVMEDKLRLLKMSSQMLLSMTPSAIVDTVARLKPNVLLFDDLDFNAIQRFPERLDVLLALFEQIRATRVLVLVTMMTEVVEKKPGAWYVEGMRPGRIDEIFQLEAPDQINRGRILNHYSLKYGIGRLPEPIFNSLVQRTAGLTGAFLAQIVERLASHGLEDWEHEMEQVLFSAPLPDTTFEPFDDDDDEDDENEGFIPPGEDDDWEPPEESEPTDWPAD